MVNGLERVGDRHYLLTEHGLDFGSASQVLSVIARTQTKTNQKKVIKKNYLLDRGGGTQQREWERGRGRLSAEHGA